MNIEDQIIELETKLSFQEETLEQLNQVIILQQNQIDSLENKIQRLHHLIKETANSHEQNPPEAEIPPHY